MRHTRYVSAFLLVAMLAGCGTGRRRGPEVGRREPQRTVLVENWTSSDLRIFVYYAGDVTMLGTVRALNRSSMALPRTNMGPMRLVAFLSGAMMEDPQHVSEQIHVFEGQQIGWQIRGTGGNAVTIGGPN